MLPLPLTTNSQIHHPLCIKFEYIINKIISRKWHEKHKGLHCWYRMWYILDYLILIRNDRMMRDSLLYTERSTHLKLCTCPWNTTDRLTWKMGKGELGQQETELNKMQLCSYCCRNRKQCIKKPYTINYLGMLCSLWALFTRDSDKLEKVHRKVTMMVEVWK